MRHPFIVLQALATPEMIVMALFRRFSLSVSRILLLVLVTAAIFPASGELESWSPKPKIEGGYIMATTTQADGKIILGGKFGTVGGLPRLCLARVNPDGTVDAEFDPVLAYPNFIVEVYATAVQTDGKIIIGGSFLTVDGVPCRNLARLQPDGSLDRSFEAQTDESVHCIGLDLEERILIGGEFTRVNGVERRHIARLAPDGSLDADFDPRMNAQVSVIRPQRDGQMLVGGWFNSIGGIQTPPLARLNVDGSLDSSFDFSSAVGEFKRVTAMAVQADGKIVVGLSHSGVSGANSGVMRLEMDGTLDPGFLMNVLNGPLRAVVLQSDGKIFLAGLFTANGASGSQSYFCQFDSAGAARPFVTNRLQRVSANLVTATIQEDGRVLLGGLIGLGSREGYYRYLNDPATQSLAVPSSSRIEWLRDGATPEVEHVRFDLSMDHGTTWTNLGDGIRMAGGWELDGLNLPAAGAIRAFGRVANTESAGLVRSQTTFDFNPNPAPVLAEIARSNDGLVQLRFTNWTDRTFTILATTNLAVPLTNWSVVGQSNEASPGRFEFTDTNALYQQRFYQLSSP